MESGATVDVEVDRLSRLPDDLIYKILSDVDIVYCIRLSVLSSRWRFIQTTIPNLNFASRQLSLRPYHEVLNNVLSTRNNNIDVSSVSLRLLEENPELSVERTLEYAFSHNVQQLSINCYNNIEIPPSRLSSKSLKHLKMINTIIDCRSHSPWDLTALTTLHLHHVKLHSCSSILAICQNLKNLTLERCEVSETEDSGHFTIINSRLLSLTLKKVKWNVDFVHVDTPQLKNFKFVDTPPVVEGRWYSRKTNVLRELTISTLSLTYLRFKGSYIPKLSFDGYCSLEKVDLCISSPQKTDVHKIRDLFQRLHSVKSLALSLDIVELLSTSEEVVSHQPSPFTTLKSLKIYALKGLKTSNSWDLKRYPFKSILDVFPTQQNEKQEAMTMKLCAEVTNYLLGSSSNATFTMVSYEEARAIKITTVVYRLMAALWEIFEKMVAYTVTKRVNVESRKTLVDSCLEDFRWGIVPQCNNEEIFCILQNIKLLLSNVLASKRIEMQACFSRLCTKTKTVLNQVAVDMKNQCDVKQHIFCRSMQSGNILDCEVDRLSNLPDDLIYKILSYVDILYCIRLSVLSSRWRFIWTSLPNLNFASDEVYRESSRYLEFVNGVLSARNNDIDVSSVRLMHASVENTSTILAVERILEYTFSHNVQQLSISLLKVQITPSRLSSESLKHLIVIGTDIDNYHSYSPWDLPALTTLHLNQEKYYIPRPEEEEYYYERPVISEFSGELTIYARELTYLRIKGSYLPKLSLDGFPSLEKVDLCIYSPQKPDVHKIRDLFQHLHSVKSLALSLEIVEFLSTSEEVISHQPSPFPCLNNLKIYPLEGLNTLVLFCLRHYQLESILEMFQTQLDEEQEAMKINFSAEVTDYLLGSASNVTFTIVSHEEARAIKITKTTYRLMAALWEFLDNHEAYTDTKLANVEWKKNVEWKNTLAEFEIITKVIFCMLQNIKVLLTKVLASKRVEMQACFSRLFAKSKTVVNKMIDLQQRILSGYFDEFDLSFQKIASEVVVL